MSNHIDIDDMIVEIISDLKKDRNHALSLLQDLEIALSGKNEHVTLGPIAVQYLGKAQKSADQMIKLIEILKKYREEGDDMGDLSGMISDQSNEESSIRNFDFKESKSILDEDG